MQSFEECFSDESIIRELCKARIKVAGDRHEALFLHNMFPASKGAEKVSAKNWGSISQDIFPPRRQWHKFRRRERRNQPSANLNLEALAQATRTLRKTSPDAPWAQKLGQTVAEIQQRVFKGGAFTFNKPEVVFVRKSADGDEYRALVVLELQDKIIDSLVARYLRGILDGALLPSCIAFRCCQPPQTIHSALDTILAARTDWAEDGIYVAECDIKGFFDSVSHDVARASLRSLTEDAKHKYPHLVVDSRAAAIFEAYLDAYVFEEDVLGSRKCKSLAEQRPPGRVKWPRQELSAIHGTDRLPRIGVPQGAALSCLVANAVLHSADKALDELAAAGKRFKYLRYCDDMILLAPDSAVCEEAFSRYLGVLQELRLPAHPAMRVGTYVARDKKSFWEGKSKEPYLWAKPASSAGIPWIQFVGYQVRFDGLVRVRPKSLKKEFRKITKAADDLLAALRRARSDRKAEKPKREVRRSKNEILHRFRHKLISMAAGRVRLGQSFPSTMPMCWTDGFRGLAGQKLVLNGLKSLDRCRERQIKRVSAALRCMRLPKRKPNGKIRVLRFYGRPFSYCGRFIK